MVSASSAKEIQACTFSFGFPEKVYNIMHGANRCGCGAGGAEGTVALAAGALIQKFVFAKPLCIAFCIICKLTIGVLQGLEALIETS